MIFSANKIVDTNNLLIGMTDNANDGKWQSETDFTENILKYLKLNFRSNDTGGSSPGKYVSHWTWNAVDSL
ncbi:hypothetical protein LCR01_20830 [Companilactobacillus crustorum]|uniref:Uncharacterized protein n=3 Tax=Companilactobacillus TaxID=2767879 RepID=A0A837RHK8_9LACO|nr:hypothetical protein [Companilactobacillus crustorum]KRK41164.1 hypothetical protein FD26_GL001736 [Companilactobacillus crustorum JCM 15951]KRO17775.1 hypothetical protein IV63_GL001663 [Companilactobacillus crustorum]GEO77640.1 hypothetical protein LCR01_20830 [Companilactobacillus crustorum]